MDQKPTPPSFELPIPGAVQQGQATVSGQAAGVQPPSMAQASAQASPPAPQAMPAMPGAAPPINAPDAPPPINQPAGPAAPATPVQPATPPVAEDVDLIEKEWVEKAKEIVARTRSDPHAQNNEMSRFKADYLKKRYSKDIKLNES